MTSSQSKREPPLMCPRGQCPNSGCDCGYELPEERAARGHTVSDYELVRPLEGLFTGQLSDDEIAAFGRLVEAGRAHREYNLLGLAKVRVHSSDEEKSRD